MEWLKETEIKHLVSDIQQRIVDLEKAITAYSEAIENSKMYENPSKYYSYLVSNSMQYGICYYAENNYLVSIKYLWWKYLNANQRFICGVPLYIKQHMLREDYKSESDNSDEMWIAKIVYTLRIRLTVMKWELGIQKMKLEYRWHI